MVCDSCYESRPYPHNATYGSVVESLKGTGFSPYMEPTNIIGALAPEGSTSEKDPLLTGQKTSTNMPLLPDLRVDQKAKPERLQHPENEPFRPIQKAQLDEVAVPKQRERPHKQRHIVVLLPQRPLALRRVSLGVGHQPPGLVLRIHLRHFAVSPAIVPRRPLGDAHRDIVNHHARQLARRSRPNKQVVLVILAVFTAANPGAKEPQMPRRTHPSVPHHPAQKLHIPRNKIPRMLRLIR